MISPCSRIECQMHHGMRQYCNHHIDGEGANHPRSRGPKGASLLGLLARSLFLLDEFCRNCLKKKFSSCFFRLASRVGKFFLVNFLIHVFSPSCLNGS